MQLLLTNQVVPMKGSIFYFDLDCLIPRMI